MSLFFFNVVKFRPLDSALWLSRQAPGLPSQSAVSLTPLSDLAGGCQGGVDRRFHPQAGRAGEVRGGGCSRVRPRRHPRGAAGRV